MVSRRTYNGCAGITAEFFRRRDEVTGRDDGRPAEEEIRQLIADEVARILAELDRLEVES